MAKKIGRIVLVTFLSLFLIYTMILRVYYTRLLAGSEEYVPGIEQYGDLDEAWRNLISGCYYINLDRAVDRRAYMEEEMAKVNIQCVRFPAIDGRTLPNPCVQGKISSGAIGCKLSHLALLKKVARRGWTLILEDDIKFPVGRNFKKEVLEAIDVVPSDAEFIMLGTSPRSMTLRFGLFQFRPHAKNMWKTTSNLTCLHAYLVRHSAARRWVKTIEDYFCAVPVDMHAKSIDVTYLYHRASTLGDFWRLLAFQDLSYVIQNKERFGYGDSLISADRF